MFGRTKEYIFLDGLAFLSAFSHYYDKQIFEIDEKTSNILGEILKLAKTEYKNPSLDKIEDHDFLSVFKLFKNEQEEYEPQMDYMSKKELLALQKNGYAVAKQIYIQLGSSPNLINKYTDEINELSWQIFFFAQTKKEQNALIKKQDELFEKEKAEDEIIDAKFRNFTNRTMALQQSYLNSLYTYSFNKKAHRARLENYVESQLETQNKLNTEKSIKKEDKLNR